MLMALFNVSVPKSLNSPWNMSSSNGTFAFITPFSSKKLPIVSGVTMLLIPVTVRVLVASLAPNCSVVSMNLALIS